MFTPGPACCLPNPMSHQPSRSILQIAMLIIISIRAALAPVCCPVLHKLPVHVGRADAQPISAPAWGGRGSDLSVRIFARPCRSVQLQLTHRRRWASVAPSRRNATTSRPPLRFQRTTPRTATSRRGSRGSPQPHWTSRRKLCGSLCRRNRMAASGARCVAVHRLSLSPRSVSDGARLIVLARPRTGPWRNLPRTHPARLLREADEELL